MKAYTMIVLLFAFYAISETAHFGWNIHPTTDAEVLADGIAGIILALAFVARGD